MKNTIFQIQNSSVRTKFESFDALKEHVDKKKVIPNDGSDKLIVEKITTEQLEVNVDVQKLSKENAVKFLEKFKEMAAIPKCLNIEDDYILHLINDIFKKENHQQNPLWTFISGKATELGITKEFIESRNHFPKFDDSDVNADLNLRIRRGKENYEKLSKLFLEYIDYIIENIDTFYELVEWRKISTNYKPCTSQCMIIQVGVRSLYFQIRKDDVVICTDIVYGRNVDCRGIQILTDDNLKL